MKVAITNAERRLGYVVASAIRDHEIHTYHNPSKKGLLWYSNIPTMKIKKDLLPAHNLLSEKELKDRVLFLKENYDVVFPISLEAIEAIIHYGSSEFPSLVPNNKAFTIMKNKEKTIKLAEEVGVPVPKTFSINDFNKLISLLDHKELEFPIVLKIKEEKAFNPNQRYCIANNFNELYYSFERLINNSSELLAQEYINGKGAGFSAIYDSKNQLHSFFMHKREVELMKSGGPSVVCRAIFSKELKKYGKLLLDSVEYSGVGMVEFKVSKKNKPYLMEVNPRFWGSLPLAIKSGVNFPKIMVSLITGKTIERVEKYDNIRLQFFYRHLFRRITDFRSEHDIRGLLKPILMLFNPNIYEGLMNLRDPISLLPIR